MESIIVIIGLVVIYYVYNLIVSDVEKKQRKKNPALIKSLEEYTTKKNLFNLYENYLYDNINYFKSVSSRKEIEEKIKQDFPNYGEGIRGMGIIEDFYYYGLSWFVNKDSIHSPTRLGPTFQIISIAYPNFNEFIKNIYNSEVNMVYEEGGYFSEFGDDIDSKIFSIILNRNTRLYLGLAPAKKYLKSKYFENFIKRHNISIEVGEIYLFTELRVSKNSVYSYPLFEIKKLRKDISKKEYHEFFNKFKKVGETFL